MDATHTPAPAERLDLYALRRRELEAWFREQGEKPFRARQVWRHLYGRLSGTLADMTDLSKALRARLAESCEIGTLTVERVQSGDGGMTRKALFRLPTGEVIEAVLMVYPDRATVCVSSQAGCPMGCVFCATAKLGFLRDLTAGQIVEQVLWAEREVHSIHAGAGGEGPDHLTNVVFMGMGEAFNNYEAWWRSVEILHDPDGFNFGARNFTVSTVGLVPGIRRLAEESLPINLAISLHTADDERRSALMPVNRAFPLAALLDATRDYVDKTGRRVSFEYVLLQEENDTPEEAEKLARLFREGPLGDRMQLVHVNLIPWNPVPGSPLARSGRKRVNAFQEILRQAGVPCTVRVERGTDIDAACGQLAGSADDPARPDG